MSLWQERAAEKVGMILERWLMRAVGREGGLRDENVFFFPKSVFSGANH